MNCRIHTRLSTDNQAEKDFSSCEAQEEKIRAFVKSQNNWGIFKVYSDPGYTGTNLNRSALQELLHDIKEGEINIVLVHKSQVSIVKNGSGAWTRTRNRWSRAICVTNYTTPEVKDVSDQQLVDNETLRKKTFFCL